MVLTDLSKFDAYRFNLLLHKIKNTKSQYDIDLVNKTEFLKGPRYLDDGRIARTVIGQIFQESNFDYELANKNFLALDSVQIEPYIKTAVLDAASCDWFYTYEKIY